MMDDLIKAFARENFGSHYRVAPQGQNKTIQPLTLIVKQSQPWYKHATKRALKTVLEELHCFLKDSHPHLESTIKTLAKDYLINGPIIKSGKGTFASSNKRTELGVTDNLKVGVTKQRDLGELNLGNLQEEYYRDYGLREILKKALLDPAKMRPYEKAKLYIITGVVYSDKLRMTGDRRQEDSIDAEVKIPMPFLEWIENLATVKAIISRVRTPATPIAKTHRSPLLFTYARVEYNTEEHRLQLKKGEFIGAKLKPLDVIADGESDGTTEEPSEEVELTAEDLVDDVEFIELDDDRDPVSILEDLFQSSEDNPKEKLEVMLIFIETTATINEMKSRTAFFLRTINYVLTSSNRSMRTELPISAKDVHFLLSTGLLVENQTHNSAKVIRVSNENMPRVRDYGLIFQHLQDIKDDEWSAIKMVAEQIKET